MYKSDNIFSVPLAIDFISYTDCLYFLLYNTSGGGHVCDLHVNVIRDYFLINTLSIKLIVYAALHDLGS